jgi:hypothetical protein
VCIAAPPAKGAANVVAKPAAANEITLIDEPKDLVKVGVPRSPEEAYESPECMYLYIITLKDTIAAFAPPNYCYSPWFGDLTHKACYLVGDTQMSWVDADNYCGTNQARLASVLDEIELNVIACEI